MSKDFQHIVVGATSYPKHTMRIQQCYIMHTISNTMPYSWTVKSYRELCHTSLVISRLTTDSMVLTEAIHNFTITGIASGNTGVTKASTGQSCKQWCVS